DYYCSSFAYSTTYIF
nr:immunoglobulin light chain junction region [Macaca mulatta]MOW18294.1 immunoglobulin light chain junction region [Macaca mulatta]